VVSGWANVTGEFGKFMGGGEVFHHRFARASVVFHSFNYCNN